MEIPSFVEDPLKYSNAYRSFEAQARRAEVDPDTVDFDQEIYDDKLTTHEMKKKIRERLGARNLEAQEEIVGVPRREWDRLSKRSGQCESRLTRCKKRLRALLGKKEAKKPKRRGEVKMSKRRSRKYPQCGHKPSLRCLEKNIGKDIGRATRCDQIKKASRRAQFLTSLGRFGKLPFTESQAKKANKRLHRKACTKERTICRKPARTCRI